MKNPERRQFIAKTSSIAFVAPAMLALGSRELFSADLPLVDESSPQAKALQYVAASITEDQSCANCALFQGGADADAAPCALFPGASVAANGWCSAWVPKS